MLIVVKWMNTWMNNQHPSISFTKECESNGSLPFLDVLIRRGQECLETSVYRKPTYSGLYMQWDSYLPKVYKRGLVIGLVNKAWRICSSFAGFHQELTFLQSVLAANGYPRSFVDNCVKQVLDKCYSGKLQEKV